MCSLSGCDPSWEALLAIRGRSKSKQLKRVFGIGADRSAVAIQKALHVNAPIDTVPLQDENVSGDRERAPGRCDGKTLAGAHLYLSCSRALRGKIPLRKRFSSPRKTRKSTKVIFSHFIFSFPQIRITFSSFFHLISLSNRRPCHAGNSFVSQSPETKCRATKAGVRSSS